MAQLSAGGISPARLPEDERRRPAFPRALGDFAPEHSYPAQGVLSLPCDWRASDYPFAFPVPHAPVHSWLIFLVSPVTRWAGLEARLVGGHRLPLPQDAAWRSAASELPVAAAVSMVTAPPASPPREEDAACRAGRLARGLTAGRGPLRRTVPATGRRVAGVR